MTATTSAIAVEQAVLLAEGGRRGHEGRRDRHHVNAEGRDVVDDFAKARQLAKLIRVSLQALRNTGYRPTKSINGLQGHDPVSDIGQHVCRRVSPQFLGGSAFQEMLTWDLKRRVWCEMVNEEIRVQKYRYVGGNVGQCQGHSSTPNSGSKAMRSTVSASPFQPSKPAVAHPADRRVDRNLDFLVLGQRQWPVRLQHAVFVRSFDDHGHCTPSERNEVLPLDYTTTSEKDPRPKSKIPDLKSETSEINKTAGES